MAVVFPLAPANGTKVSDAVTGLTWAYDSARAAWIKQATGTLYSEVVPITAYGQTVLTMVATPLVPSTVYLKVNGVEYYQTVDFTIAANVITWAGSFNLDTTDYVVVVYQ